MNRIFLIVISVLIVIALAIGGWFGLGWLQIKRADSSLADANAHIEEANRLMAAIKVEELGPESFSSLDNINRAAEAVVAMLPLIEQAATDVRAAGEESGSAAGMPLLPDWYSSYLQNKQKTAEARGRQLATLSETANRLRELYAAGPLVFSSVQEMDRLFGQFQAAMGKIQTSPGEATAMLAQVAASFAEVQKQLEESFAQTGFEILPDLSKTAADNAELARLAARLADAAGAGDQAKAQQVASQLEEKLLATSISGDAIGAWWQQQIKPLEQDYKEVQTEEEELDADAAALYEQRRHAASST